MANSIINSQGRSVLHIDSTDGAITLAELTATNEATVVSADIGITLSGDSYAIVIVHKSYSGG